jgi:glycosyltransferase involved in cell wall biosynthesis
MIPERPLRLCILAPVMRRHRGYFTPHSGLVARVLADLGHEVVVLTADLPEGGGAVERENGYEVRYLAGTPAEKKGGPFWKDSALAFDRLHADRPFDIVFGRGVATWGFFRHSRFAKTVPVVLHEGTYPRWLHQIETRAVALAPLLARLAAPLFALKNRKTHACLQRASRVVCITPELAAAHRRAAWWHPPHSVALTYGFDTSRYYHKDAFETVPPRLVSLGRLAWDKGVLRMIDVLAGLKHKTATLEAIGPASPKVRKTVLTHAAKLGVGARYSAPGAVQHEQVPDRLAGAAVFLFPSTHAEGLGKVVLEAMASSLPVVAYRLPVLEGLVEDGVTGFLVPIRNATAMTERVDQLLADPALVARMGAAARRKIEIEFTPEAINAQWQALLAEVVAEATSLQGG